MALVISTEQERGIDALVDLIFDTAEAIATAKPWRRRRAVEKAQQNLQEPSTKFNVACWHGLSEAQEGLAQLYFVATHYFEDITLTNPDPGHLTAMGRAAVVAGMRGAVEHCEHAFVLSELMGAEVEKGWRVSLRNLITAGLALSELAVGDPQMSLVGPGIDAYYHAVMNEDEDAGNPGSLVATLRNMVELARLD